ncbi:MAG: 16S rRNA (cytosine(967)-C(5))-methyltransferase RsmB [Caldicoprobacterales bacterium]|nr:16S rRNA (cytosine(967)-C(5))-methyltransferase RsmB [Clostridiales bacterium]
MDKARRIALIVLKEVNEDQKYANISLKEHINRAKLDERDAAFATQLVYGTLENQGVIDRVLRQFAKMSRVNPWVKNILRMGCYQILYLDRVPDSAACNESVKLCQMFGFAPLKGFINGVLRNISRKKDSLRILKETPTDLKSLSSLYGFPLWLVEMWAKEYGIEATRKIVKSSVGSSWTTIRINRRKTSRDEIIERLKKQGAEVKKGLYFDNALRVKGIGNIQSNPLYQQGLFTVQSESSMLACHILNPKPGEYILDACSAPGGKAIYLAELMNMEGKIYAFDNHDHRVGLINKNRERMNAAIVHSRVQDGTKFNPEFEENMDRVLLDVPCSGWGVIHKKPDIKLRISKEDLSSLCQLQWDILENSSRYLKYGGMLVYSTCTINPYENNKLVERFIKEHPEFVLEGFDKELPDGLKSFVIQDGMIQLLPNKEGLDGFFIARLRRAKKR